MFATFSTFGWGGGEWNKKLSTLQTREWSELTKNIASFDQYTDREEAMDLSSHCDTKYVCGLTIKLGR